MEKKCAICKKKFDVLYPDLWRYKRGDGGNIRAWFCTYGCMRKYDKRKEEGKMARPRKDGTPARKQQKKTEIEVAEKLPEPEKEWTPAEEVHKKQEPEKIMGQDPLEIAAVYSRVLHDATFKKINGGMCLVGLGYTIMMTAYQWFKFSEEILVAIRQLDATKVELDPEDFTGNNGPLPGSGDE